MNHDLAFTPALDQAALVRAGDVSALELVELYLERIERLDPQLNAYVTVDADGAHAAAQAPGHPVCRADADRMREADVAARYGAA